MTSTDSGVNIQLEKSLLKLTFIALIDFSPSSLLLLIFLYFFNLFHVPSILCSDTISVSLSKIFMTAYGLSAC